MLKTAKTLEDKVITLLLFFIPSIIFIISIKLFTNGLANLTGLSKWNTQNLIMVIFLFLFEVGFTAFLLILKEKLSIKESALVLGLSKINLKDLLLAVIIGVVAFALVRIYLVSIGFFLGDMLNQYSIFQNKWHININPNEPDNVIKAVPYSVILNFFVFTVINCFSEEIYFRGYLFKKQEYFGKYTWLINGLLFTLYHIFQPAKTYPLFPCCLVISGYFQWRRSIYGAIIIHFIFNYGSII